MPPEMRRPDLCCNGNKRVSVYQTRAAPQQFELYVTYDSNCILHQLLTSNTSTDLLPTEWCDTFIPLQDKCPVSSFESIKEMVEKETGEKLDDIFEDFSTQPLGSASLAQVHLAIDKRTGQRVAVKVQHPVLDLWAPLDLWLTKLTFQTLKTAFPDYDLTWLSDEMEVSLPKELDFVKEGQNAIRAKEYFSQIPDTPLVIPGGE